MVAEVDVRLGDLYVVSPGYREGEWRGWTYQDCYFRALSLTDINGHIHVEILPPPEGTEQRARIDNRLLQVILNRPEPDKQLLPIVGLAAVENLSPEEALMRKIQDLHRRQPFYATHREFLTSW